MKVVIMKVCLIDSLYGTNTKGVISVAEHIVSLKIDEWLRIGDIHAVMGIADWTRGERTINIISFASKYCHFHNKSKFPIYDKYASVALENVLGKIIWPKECRNYAEYQRQIERVRDGRSMEDIDAFLWLYGIKQALEEDRRDVNKEVASLFERDRVLFGGLDR